ncbi:hypothetical protein [Kitasatospora sp. NPDC057223]
MMLLLLALLFLAAVEIVWLGAHGRHRGSRQLVRAAAGQDAVARHRR